MADVHLTGTQSFNRKHYDIAGISSTVNDSFATGHGNQPFACSWDGTNEFDSDDSSSGFGKGKLFMYSGFSSTIADSADHKGGYEPEGDTTDASDTYTSDSDDADKIWHLDGKVTTTINNSFGTTGFDTAVKGISIDDGPDLYVAGTTNDKLFKMSGFSSTVGSSIDVSGVDTSPWGITWDGSNTLWIGQAATKIYQQTGFTSTLADSADISSVNTSPTDCETEDFDSRTGGGGGGGIKKHLGIVVT